MKRLSTRPARAFRSLSAARFSLSSPCLAAALGALLLATGTTAALAQQGGSTRGGAESISLNTGNYVATNGIAAQVDDKVITLDQLRQQISPIVPEIRRRSQSREQFEQNIGLVTREVLQNMIDQILITKEFNEKGYQLPETYVRNELNDYITKNFGGDRSRFLESLKAQGTNEMAFRNQMRDNIIVSYMRSQMVRSATQVSPEEINQYYQQHRSQFYEEAGVKLSMIMLRPGSGDNGQLVPQQVETIEKALKDGTPFADLAKKYSQGPNAAEGGDWGWRRYSDLRKDLADVAEKLDKGQYSQPVTLDGVTYILYIEDKRDSGIKDLDTVRAEIERSITAQLARQAQQRWLERLRRQAYVKYYLEEAGPSPVIDNSPVTMRLGQQTSGQSDEDKDAGQFQPLPAAPAGMPEASPHTPESLPQSKPKPKRPLGQADPAYNPEKGRFE